MSVLSRVTREAKPMPPRVVLYAAEKFGKTSWAAHSWNPIFLMTAGETGLLSLLEAGRVPAVDHFPEDFRRWHELVEAVKGLRDDQHNYRTLVLDTGNGAEQLCAAAVCEDRFGGDWADYMSYGRGNEQAAKQWADFLRLLDDTRLKRRMAVILLQHAKIKTFQDPAGKDWDQWRPEAIDKLWALTHKWADCILFGGFKVQVKNDKATSEDRYLRAEASGAVVAGNRYGIPAELTARPGAANLWKAFADALAKAKTKPEPKPAVAQPAAEKPATDEPPEADHAAGEPAPAPGSEVAYIGRDMAQQILEHLDALGVDWEMVRDNYGAGKGLADAAGFQALMDFKVTELRPEQGLKLLDALKKRVDSRQKAAVVA
jgi:hypothetical protein